MSKRGMIVNVGIVKEEEDRMIYSLLAREESWTRKEY